MGKKKMSQSIRKFIRQEKARIRREVLDMKKQKELINQVYQRFLKKNEDKRNLQSGDK